MNKTLYVGQTVGIDKATIRILYDSAGCRGKVDLESFRGVILSKSSFDENNIGHYAMVKWDDKGDLETRTIAKKLSGKWYVYELDIERIL